MKRSEKSLIDCARAKSGATKPTMFAVSGKFSPADVFNESATTLLCQAPWQGLGTGTGRPSGDQARFAGSPGRP